MDTSVKDEVMKDFKDSVSKIDFTKYNPKSNEFETALFTGLMWMILNEAQEGDLKIESNHEDETHDEVSDEIHGAKKYLQRYIDTKDENYKKMARDELDHASFLIKRAYNRPIGMDERNRLKKYESDIMQVNEQIGMA